MKVVQSMMEGVCSKLRKIEEKDLFLFCEQFAVFIPFSYRFDKIIRK